MTFGENLKELRKKMGLTQPEFAKLFQISNGAIALWETNKRQPDHETLIRLATFFNVSIDYLLGREDEERIKDIGGMPIPNDKFAIPLVGQVVCGKPIESAEYFEGYVYVDYKNADEYFALKVKGDSMIGAGITPKSILIVHKQNYAEDGDIVVASINGESTTKRFKKNNDTIFLMPENSAYSPILVTADSSFYIFGKVVEVRTVL